MARLRRKVSRSRLSSVGIPLLNRRRSNQFKPGLLDRGEQIMMDGGRRKKESSGLWTERKKEEFGSEGIENCECE